MHPTCTTQAYKSQHPEISLTEQNSSPIVPKGNYERPDSVIKEHKQGNELPKGSTSHGGKLLMVFLMGLATCFYHQKN